ncbi:MAG: DUF302 domain-containing protein [Bacteroidales bacterium]|nr:DUF302 domain-containing protein [Bacteroidales bacterium]
MVISILFLITGMLLMGISVWIIMPKLMLTNYKSDYNYEETLKKLTIAIDSKGDWKVTREFDFQKNIADGGFDRIERVGSLALCNPKYASMILAEEHNRKVTSIMPLKLGIFEKKNGDVYVSELNIGLMGMMFGGTIAKVMSVAGKDVKEIIASVAK